MNRLHGRLERLEKKIGVDFESYVRGLSDEEIESRVKSLIIKLGIDPNLPLEEIIRIAKEMKKNESVAQAH